MQRNKPKPMKTRILFLVLQFFLYSAHGQLIYRNIGNGTDSAVLAMVNYNGNLIVAGNTITKAGNTSVNRIARWDGTSWHTLGTGISGSIQSMAVYNNELYVAGSFSTAGGVSVNNIARWNGTTWAAVGSGIAVTSGGIVNKAMAVYNGELYVGGNFTTAGGQSVSNIAKWNGTSWSPVGTGVSGIVYCMIVHNNSLVIGGIINNAGGISVANIAKWNGTAWLSHSSGFTGAPPFGGLVYSLGIHNNELYAGGNFTTAGGVSASGIARFNGSAWSALGQGLSIATNPPNPLFVYAMASTSTGLVIGGTFSGSGTVSSTNLILWKGTSMESIDSGLNGPVYAMTEYNNIIATGGNFTKFNVTKSATYSNLIGLSTFLFPSIPAVNIVYSNISVSSMNISCTKGDGKKRLLVAKAGAPVDVFPRAGIKYNANASFGSGDNLGNGNFVVYADTGNSITLNNLNPDIIYHFAVYEYNDSAGVPGNEAYLTTNPATGFRTTLATEPTQQSTGTPLYVDFSSISLSFSGGNGSKRILIAKMGSPVNRIPADTNEYTANSLFGSSGTDLGAGNFVVYNGNGNTVTVTGLTPNTPYYFICYEYNGSSSKANNFLLSDARMMYQSTLTTEPTTGPTSILFTNVKDSSITLSWTVGNGQRRIVICGTSAVSVLLTDGIDYLANDTFSKGADMGFGNYVVYSGTSNSFNLKGLTPNTTYHFAIFEYNGTNTSNNYLLSLPAIGSKSTLIAEPTVPASNLTLSPITNGITTVNWTNGNGANRIVIVREGAPINILPEDGMGYTANAVWGNGQNLGQGNFVCYIGNSNTFNLQGLDPSNLYYIGVIEYNGSGGGSNYKLDQFTIADNLPPEPTVLSTGMTFGNLTDTSVKVSWSSGNGAYRILIAKQGSPVAKKPVDGTVYVANNIFGNGADLGLAHFVVYNGIGNSAIVTNLSNNTTYHFSLFEFNKDASGPTNYSSNSLNNSVTLGTNGLAGMDVIKTLSVYPNPVSRFISIKVEEGVNAFVEVYNSKGVLVDEFKFQHQTTRNLGELPFGIYLLKVSTTVGIQTVKLIKHN